MKKLLMFATTLMIAIISIYFGFELYQAKHNGEVVSQHIIFTNNYSENNAVYFNYGEFKNNDIQKIVNNLMDIADKTNSDIFISLDNKIEKSDNIDPDKIVRNNFIYSNKNNLFKKEMFIDEYTLWNRSSSKVYSTYKDTSVNRIINSNSGFMEKVNKINFIPLIKLKDYIENLDTRFLSFTVLSNNKVEFIKLLKEDKFSTINKLQIDDTADKKFLSSGKAYMFLFLILLPILTIIITSYSLDVIESSKEIGVRKINGQNSQFITRKKFIKTSILIPVTFLIGILISSLLFIKHWNYLTLKFYYIIGLLFISLILVVFAAIFMTNRFVSKVIPAVSNKSKRSLSLYTNIGIFIKTLLITLLISQLSMIAVRVDSNMTLNRAKKIFNNPSKLNLIVKNSKNKTKDELESLNVKINDIYDNNFSNLDKLTFDYSIKGSKKGSLNETGKINREVIKENLIKCDYKFIKNQSIYKIDGTKININNEPLTPLFLIPEDLSLSDISSVDLMDIQNRGNIVKIKKNQSIYLPVGIKFKNPIIIICPSEIGLTTEILDTQRNRKLLTEEFLKKKIDKSEFSFSSIPTMTYNVSLESNKEIIKREVITTIFVLMAFILSLSHNTYVYLKDKIKYITIQYLNGVSFFKRTKNLWNVTLIPYLISLIIIIVFPKVLIYLLQLRADFEVAKETTIPIFAIFVGVFITFLIELIFQVVLIKNIQVKGTAILKGDI